jgi:hypothetical protein
MRTEPRKKIALLSLVVVVLITIVISLIVLTDSGPGVAPGGSAGERVLPEKARPASEPALLPASVSDAVSGDLSQSRFDGMMAELTAMARKDPKLAFDRISKITPVSHQQRFRTALAKLTLFEDFSRVGEMMKFMNDVLERQQVLSDSIMMSLRKDPAKTTQLVREQLTGDSLNHALRFVVQEHLQSNQLDEAMAVQLSMPFSGVRDQAIANIAGSIGKRGIDAALKWVDQLAPEGEQPSARDSILQYFLGKRDYPALQKLLAGAKGDARKTIIRSLAAQYSFEDPAAQPYLNSLTPPERDITVSSQILGNKSMTNARKMEMAGKLATPEARSGVFSTVIANEVSADPASAAKFVMALPQERRREGVSALVQSWAAVDSEAVSVWVQELPTGPIREHAIQSLAMRLRYVDRSAAQQVATWMADEKSRAQLLKMVGR